MAWEQPQLREEVLEEFAERGATALVFDQYLLDVLAGRRRHAEVTLVQKNWEALIERWSRLPDVVGPCVRCGRPVSRRWVGGGGQQRRYCAPPAACREEAQKALLRALTEERRRAKEAREGPCARCGCVFSTTDTRKAYCTPLCRQRAAYARQNARRRAPK